VSGEAGIGTEKLRKTAPCFRHRQPTMKNGKSNTVSANFSASLLGTCFASSTIWNLVRTKYKTEGLSNLNHTSLQFEINSLNCP
jgi:hypothetical protein